MPELHDELCPRVVQQGAVAGTSGGVENLAGAGLPQPSGFGGPVVSAAVENSNLGGKVPDNIG